MRKYIDILNELAITDFSGGGDEGNHVRVYNIIWDTDGEDVDLPDSLVLMAEGESAEEMQEAISDALSEHFGWCVSNFDYALI